MGSSGLYGRSAITGERFDLQTVLNAEFIGLDSVIVGTSYGHGIFRQTVYSEVTNGHRVVGWNPTVDGWYQELGMLVGLVQEANRGNGRGFQYVGHDMDDDAEVIIAIACND